MSIILCNVIRVLLLFHADRHGVWAAHRWLICCGEGHTAKSKARSVRSYQQSDDNFKMKPPPPSVSCSRGGAKGADDHLSLYLSSISYPATGTISSQTNPVPLSSLPSFLLNNILINPVKFAFQLMRTVCVRTPCSLWTMTLPWKNKLNILYKVVWHQERKSTLKINLG